MNPTLDQAMEYALVIGGVCMTEITNTYEAMENQMMMEVDWVCWQVTTVDVQMDEVHEQMQDVDARMAEVKECIGALDLSSHIQLDAVFTRLFSPSPTLSHSLLSHVTS